MQPLKTDWKAENFLNVSDLNRLEEWTTFLYNKLIEYGYAPFNEERKLWEKEQIPTSNDIDRIRKNIVRLKDSYFAIPEWRELILGNTHNFEQQNAMEWDLQMCYNWIKRMVSSFPVCGESLSGGEYF